MTLPKTPAEHGRLLHPAGSEGKVVIVARDGNVWRHHTVTVEELPHILTDTAGREDRYMTVNRFWWRRVITQTAQLDGLFADCDFYKTPLADRNVWDVMEYGLQLLEDAHLPAPTLAVNSGRGLLLLWLHTAVPRNVLSKWNACQSVIADALAPIGADPKARDAARVFRIIGSVNSKNGKVVEAIASHGPVWEFGDLADEILPLTRAELEALRKEREDRRQRKELAAQTRLWVPTPENIRAGRLWEARLRDLEILLHQVRWFGQLPEHQRNAWMFTTVVAATYLKELDRLVPETYDLARQVTYRGRLWTPKETRSRMFSVLDRAKRHHAGETIEWPPGSGRRVDVRYRLRTSTIIRDLEITEDEMQHLRVLVNPEIRRERRRQYFEVRHRAEGMRERDLYLKQARTQTERQQDEARILRGEGHSVRHIAEALGVTPRRVYQLLAGDALIDATAGAATTGEETSPKATGNEERLVALHTQCRPFQRNVRSRIENVLDLEGDDEDDERPDK